MNSVEITFCGERLEALGSGALYWPGRRTLAVSDLHLGKSERIARRSGQMLPPYEVMDTLTRLENAIEACQPEAVICLGDSFDDLSAGAALADWARDWITRLSAGRHWIWIEGNHDPGPLELPGMHLGEMRAAPFTFRHIAQTTPEPGEISGHYHPKKQLSLRGRVVTRACFLMDQTRMILPAFGTYTGGLRSSDPALSALFPNGADTILTGPAPCLMPGTRAAS